MPLAARQKHTNAIAVRNERRSASPSTPAAPGAATTSTFLIHCFGPRQAHERAGAGARGSRRRALGSRHALSLRGAVRSRAVRARRPRRGLDGVDRTPDRIRTARGSRHRDRGRSSAGQEAELVAQDQVVRRATTPTTNATMPTIHDERGRLVAPQRDHPCASVSAKMNAPLPSASRTMSRLLEVNFVAEQHLADARADREAADDADHARRRARSSRAGAAPCGTRRARPRWRGAASFGSSAACTAWKPRSGMRAIEDAGDEVADADRLASASASTMAAMYARVRERLARAPIRARS